MKIIFEKEGKLGTLFRVEYSNLTNEYIVGCTDCEGNQAEDIYSHNELISMISELKASLENGFSR